MQHVRCLRATCGEIALGLNLVLSVTFRLNMLVPCLRLPKPFPPMNDGSNRTGCLRIQACCCALVSLWMLLISSGCGTTKMREATDQLLLSNAVDQSISTIDFRPLSGQKVYLDTSYIRQVKSVGFVNADYVTSAMRQQIVSAGCLLQDSSKEADIVIEARIGALGADGYQTTYGLPASSALSSAAELVSSSPAIPAIPEISLARRESSEGAARIAAFAYDSETRQPVWQSGVSQASATSKDTWVMGLGPIQGGSIRKKTRLAGSDLIDLSQAAENGSGPRLFERPPVDYTAQVHFLEGWPLLRGEAANQRMLGGSQKKPETAETPDAELAGQELIDELTR